MKKEHLIVGKTFLRVVKNHKLYPILKRGYKRFVKSNELIKESNRNYNLLETFDVINNIAKKDYLSHRRNLDDKYEPTTFMVNTFIRCFLERQLAEERKKIDLGMLGQEIFDLSCYKIFGDEFLKDMEALQKDIPQPKSNEDLFLIQTYQELRNRGEISNMSYHDFIRQHGEYFIEKYKESFENGRWR